VRMLGSWREHNIEREQIKNNKGSIHSRPYRAALFRSRAIAAKSCNPTADLIVTR
jgi:hypothetical protein